MDRTVLVRRLVARFKAPRDGFPPEVHPLAEKWTGEAEKRGHDLGDWKLKYKSSPQYGWVSKCVKCESQFLIEADKGPDRGALYRGDGYKFSVENPILYPDEWENSSCEVKPLDVIRGIRVLTDDPAAMLVGSTKQIADGLLKVIMARGLGPHWTNPHNRQVSEDFAMGPKSKPGVPVILYAQFRREDQRRNYKPKGFWVLEDFHYEQEVNFGNNEVLRLQSIEWHDGQQWVKHHLNDVKVKA
jgi:hypothetical protein